MSYPFDGTPAERTDWLRHQAYTFIRADICPILNWKEFETAVHYWIGEREKVPVQSNYSDVLPSLSYHALGGDPQRSIALTAAWMLSIFGARVLDDIHDQDNANKPWIQGRLGEFLPVGVAALTAANICLSCLETDQGTLREILGGFGRVGALAAKNQGHPTVTYGSAQSLERYFTHIGATTAELFAAGLWAGGRLHSTDTHILQALREFGLGLGMKTAIVLDCRDLSPRSPHKLSDLTTGNYKLPVLYAVSTLKQHSDYGLLMKMLQEGNLFGNRLKTVTAILIEMGALSWCVQLALEYEGQARRALALLPDAARRALSDYV
jgi:hypothetical protein